MLGNIVVYFVNRKPFIQDNIQFYTMLMTEFLQRALKLNLMDLRDTVLIQRVAKVNSIVVHSHCAVVFMLFHAIIYCKLAVGVFGS